MKNMLIAVLTIAADETGFAGQELSQPEITRPGENILPQREVRIEVAMKSGSAEKKETVVCGTGKGAPSLPFLKRRPGPA